MRLWPTLFFTVSVQSFVTAHVLLGSPLTATTAADSSLPRRNEVLSDAISSTIIESSNDASSGHSLGAWMPLGSASSLTGLSPTQIRVCGIDLAVWHKPLPKNSKRGAVATEWSALVDTCPHRLAPLSQGRVDQKSGCIECPYHGWSFDTDGSLQTIPQLDEGRTITAATGNAGGATSLPVHAAGDVLFVFLPTEVSGESWPISRLPEHHYSNLQEQMGKDRTYYVRDLPYSFDFLIENLADPSHIPFAHHSLLETRADGSPIDMKVTASNFTHYECEYQVPGKQRTGVLAFERPAFFYYRRTDDVKIPPVHFFTCPIDEGRSRIIYQSFRIKFVPKWLVHLAMNQFLNADAWLHDAERSARINMAIPVGAARAGRKSSYGLNYMTASKSDMAPLSFRKWWTTYGFADAPPHTFRPSSASSLPKHALSRSEQIDPWMNHAKHCSSCRRALRQMRFLQKVVTASAAIGAIMCQRRPPFALASVLIGIYVHNFLRKLATTIEGNTNRAEIGDRSVASIK